MNKDRSNYLLKMLHAKAIGQSSFPMKNNEVQLKH